MQSKTLFSIIIMVSNLFDLAYCTLHMWKTIMNNIMNNIIMLFFLGFL